MCTTMKIFRFYTSLMERQKSKIKIQTQKMLNKAPKGSVDMRKRSKSKYLPWDGVVENPFLHYFV